MKAILTLSMVLIPLALRAVSLTGAQTGPNEWTYTLTYAPLDNYSIFEPQTTITLTNLFGVTNAAGPISADFPSTWLNEINTNWTAEVLDGGTTVRWTHLGPGTGNFGDERHVFGFRIFAPGAADGLVSLTTSGFSRDTSNPLPGGGFDLDITGVVAGPVRAPNGPPAVTCPAATVVECATEAELTAQVSDPEGDPTTIVWMLNGTAVHNQFLPASSPGTVANISLSGSFPLGTNLLQISVTDETNVVSCTTSVTVFDTTPPVIDDVTASPMVLWPPDHKMARVTVRASVLDACGPASWRIVAIQSNEPGNARGDGDTSPDWSIADEETVFLRAERSGRGNGRIYYIQVQATDASGNQSDTQTVSVTVPKSQGKLK